MFWNRLTGGPWNIVTCSGSKQRLMQHRRRSYTGAKNRYRRRGAYSTGISELETPWNTTT